MCSVLFRAAFIGDAYQAQSSLSRFLYPIASARWEVCIDSQPSRSAIVRDTFKIRSYARAERLKRFMAFFNKASPLSSGRAKQASNLLFIWALQYTPGTPVYLSDWIWRARTTRSRISALDSPGRESDIFSNGTGMTSICRSIQLVII